MVQKVASLEAELKIAKQQCTMLLHICEQQQQSLKETIESLKQANKDIDALKQLAADQSYLLKSRLSSSILNYFRRY